MDLKKHSLEIKKRKFLLKHLAPPTQTQQIRFMSMLGSGLATSLANSIKYPSVWKAKCCNGKLSMMVKHKRTMHTRYLLRIHSAPRHCLCKKSLPFMFFHPLLNVRCLNNASLWANAISLQKYVVIVPHFSTAWCFFLVNRIPHISSRIRLGKLVKIKKKRLFPTSFY